MKQRKRIGLVAALGLVAVGAAAASAVIASDWGVRRDAELARESEDLFGIRAPLAASSLTSIDLATAQAEDLEVAPVDLAAGRVKVCGNNTGSEFVDHNWGKTVCITDGTLAESLAGTAVPEVRNLLNGSIDMAMTDNIAPQPGPSGRWLIAEDGDVELGTSITPGKNNDMFLCLPDGADVDDQSDGCIKVASLNDAGTAAHPDGAEWTGPIFTDDGKHLYVSVQHNITGRGVVLDITGWDRG